MQDSKPRRSTRKLVVKARRTGVVRGGYLPTSRSFLTRHGDNYKPTTDGIVAQFGKSRLVSDLAAGDFEALRKSLSATRSPVALGNAIQHVRIVFKYASGMQS